jgi:hypothetical protein
MSAKRLSIVEAATSSEGREVRAYIMTYKAYALQDMVMAVYVIRRCGLVAVVEFVKENDMDCIKLYAESPCLHQETTA